VPLTAAGADETGPSSLLSFEQEISGLVHFMCEHPPKVSDIQHDRVSPTSGQIFESDGYLSSTGTTTLLCGDRISTASIFTVVVGLEDIATRIGAGSGRVHGISRRRVVVYSQETAPTPS
jgi:hypothetical protein